MSEFISVSAVGDMLQSGPVICWVTKGYNIKSQIRCIVAYEDRRYISDSGEMFYFARLLSADDKKLFFRD